MRVRVLAIAAVVMAGSLAFVAPAQADDFNSYSARHMLRVSDLPTSGLGDLGSRRTLFIPWDTATSMSLCYTPELTEVRIPGRTRTNRALFAINEEEGAVVNE